jgi:hypothetical protein
MKTDSMKPYMLLIMGLVIGVFIGVGLDFKDIPIDIMPKDVETNDKTDMFYLAVGLYENETHPCPTHEITCLAEFKSAPLNFTIVSLDGTYIMSETIITDDNGFFDLYLPKNKEYISTFTIDGKSGGGAFTTKKGASNCITEIHVK